MIHSPRDNRALRYGAAKPAVYHVVSSDEGWAVQQEGSESPVGIYRTKSEATKEARRLAKATTPSRLVLHRKDGTVQDSTAYEA